MQEKDGAEHVDGVESCEMGCGDVRKFLVSGYTGVVDDDVYLKFSALGVREVVFDGCY